MFAPHMTESAFNPGAVGSGVGLVNRRSRSEGPTITRNKDNRIANANSVGQTNNAVNAPAGGGAPQTSKETARSEQTDSSQGKSQTRPAPRVEGVQIPGKAVPGKAVVVKVSKDLQNKREGELKGDEEVPHVIRRWELSSEYRLRYRPFSQYEYVDGTFVSNKNVDHMSKSDNAGHPWYAEVVELRKRAKDYKCRGWGTDLAPPHISELYHKQVELHEQAKSRESLAALALAFTTPRPTDPLGEDAVDSRTPRPRPAPQARASRPGTAPPPTRQSPLPKKTGEERPKTAHQPKRPTPTARPRTAANARPGSAQDRGGESAGPRKDVVDAGSASPDTPGGWKVHRTAAKATKAKAKAQAQAPEHRRQRPSKRPEPGSHPVAAPRAKTLSRGSSAQTAGNSRPHSAVENSNNADFYLRDPVVKTPPEPTRVRSPEGAARSPDPINWTVPLDTGKTFSVTQRVTDAQRGGGSPAVSSNSHVGDVGSALETKKKSSVAKDVRPGKSDTGGSHAIIPPRDDIMMTAIYQPAAEDVGGPEVNGSSSAAASASGRSVPGTSLRCLEDPSFQFEPASAAPQAPEAKKASKTTAEDVRKKAGHTFAKLFGKK